MDNQNNKKEKRVIFSFKGFSLKKRDKPSPVVEFKPGVKNPYYRKRITKR